VAAGERLQQYVSRGFGVRGHLREALNVQPPHDYSMVLAGQLGILPEDSIRTRMAGWQGPPFVFASWLLARRDTAGLRALVQAADSLAGLPGRGPEQHRSTTVNVQSTRAYLALARGDSAAALAALAAIPDTLLGPVALRLMQAQLLAAQGRERDAARLLDQSTWRNLISPSRVLIALERARLAERLGEPNRALDGYQQVVGLWRHADPELQPFVSEARAGLERLTAETRRR
jgi:hypothetical protein